MAEVVREVCEQETVSGEPQLEELLSVRVIVVPLCFVFSLRL